MNLLPKRRYGRAGYPPEIIRAMHADLQELGTLAAVGRKWSRSASNIRDVLQPRGLYAPDPQRVECTKKNRRNSPVNGQWLPYPKLTARQLSNLIDGMTTFRLPSALRSEWRSWPMERKAKLIARLRKKFRNPRRDRPTTPFSSNVQPFDYASPAAWTIMRRVNAGKPSRYWTNRIFPNSWGVIWNDQLWFWVPYNDPSKGQRGSYQFGKFVRGEGRKQLHHAIWEKANGRPVPPHHVVRFLDANPNNLAPENLALESRRNMAVMNRGNFFLKRSRAITARLLERSQQNGKDKA